MSYKIHSEYGWPTQQEKTLLRAILLNGDEAIQAWHEWRDNLTGAAFDKSVSSVLPSLYLKLRQQEMEIDDGVLLRERYTKTLQKNQIARQTLLEVVDLLQTHNISTMVPKGIPLFLFYYPDKSARTMSDIDLLIHYEDVPAAIAVLQEQNWQTKQQLLPLSLMPFYHAIDFHHESRTSVDLHWYAFKVGSPSEAESQLWQRAVTRRVDKTLLKIPDASDLLIQVCYHCRKMDRLAKCRWVIDASVLIQAAEETIDWSALIERIQQARLVLPVRDTLTYLHQEFYQIVPQRVIDELWRLPVSKADERNYFEIMRESADRRGIAELIISHWRRYQGSCQARGLAGDMVGFIKYCLRFSQWFWQAPSLWRLPWIAMTRLAKRLPGVS